MNYGATTKALLGGEGKGRNPIDRGKSGTKRSLLTEGNGIPLSVMADGANRHDKKLVESRYQGIGGEIWLHSAYSRVYFIPFQKAGVYFDKMSFNEFTMFL